MSKFYRKEEKHYRGKENSYVFKTEELSDFDQNGNVRTYLKTEQPVTQGIMPHAQTEIVGECQTCFTFLTKEMYSRCELCLRVCCLPCSVRNQKLIVCPLCSELLNKNRLRMIIRKFFIDPFLEVK